MAARSSELHRIPGILRTAESDKGTGHSLRNATQKSHITQLELDPQMVVLRTLVTATMALAAVASPAPVPIPVPQSNQTCILDGGACLIFVGGTEIPVPPGNCCPGLTCTGTMFESLITVSTRHVSNQSLRLSGLTAYHIAMCVIEALLTL